mmetsp:Transcript_114797/g.245043  ORF Transcript_114797/g.245043 Transcript_114797/m.245043 type:complete len:220 (-) Transcript_114797:21-680(-)
MGGCGALRGAQKTSMAKATVARRLCLWLRCWGLRRKSCVRCRLHLRGDGRDGLANMGLRILRQEREQGLLAILHILLLVVITIRVRPRLLVWVASFGTKEGRQQEGHPLLFSDQAPRALRNVVVAAVAALARRPRTLPFAARRILVALRPASTLIKRCGPRNLRQRYFRKHLERLPKLCRLAPEGERVNWTALEALALRLAMSCRTGKHLEVTPERVRG